MEENKVEEKVEKPIEEKKVEEVKKELQEPKVETPPEETESTPLPAEEAKTEEKEIIEEPVEEKAEEVAPVEEKQIEEPKIDTEKIIEDSPEEAPVEKPKEEEPVVEETKEEEKPQKEILTSGRALVKISDNCKHRSWTDIIPSWVIYRGRTKLTPNRWTRSMKKAVRDGLLEVVDRSPKGPISSFNPVGPKGVEVQKIEKTTSDKDTKVEKNKIIELVQKPKETEVIIKPGKKLDEVIRSKKPEEIEVKIKEAPLPKEYTEAR